MINIITLSDKMLLGKSKDLLSDYISEKLFKNNFRIKNRIILPTNDDLSAIIFNKAEVYVFFVQKFDAINNKICKYFNCEMYDNAYMKNEISEYYKSINIPLDSETINSWKIPQIARGIINQKSKYQGYLIDKDNTLIFVLPIEYKLAENMIDNSVLPYLLGNKSEKYISNNIRTFGISENNLISEIKDEIYNKRKVSVNIFSNGLDNDIVIKSKDGNEYIDELTRIVYKKLEKYVYSVTDYSLNSIFEKLLKDKGITISIVEAVSGGNVICSLSYDTRLNNIKSSYIVDNFNSIKELFKVNSNQNAYPEVAYDIAFDVLNGAKSDLVIVTYGYFNGEKSLAETYISIGDKNKIDIFKNVFSGNYQDILSNIKNAVLFYSIKKIRENDFVFYNK